MSELREEWMGHADQVLADARSRRSGAFVKIAVRIEELKGRIRLAFPTAYPHQTILATITGAILKGGP